MKNKDEMIQYLMDNRDYFRKEYKSVRVGMNLNVMYYFGAIIYIELAKKFNKVPLDIFYMDNVIVDVFGEVLDNSCLDLGETVLEESFKSALIEEAKVSILTNFVMELISKKKTYYRSEMKRKIKTIENAQLRAEKCITKFIGEENYTIKDAFAFDMYEITVDKTGKFVSLHLGDGNGFSLFEESSYEEFKACVLKLRKKKQYILNEYNELDIAIKEAVRKLNDSYMISAAYISNILGNGMQRMNPNEYDLIRIRSVKTKLDYLIRFASTAFNLKKVIPKDIRIDENYIKVRDFKFAVSENETYDDFFLHLNNYQKNIDMIEEIRSADIGEQRYIIAEVVKDIVEVSIGTRVNTDNLNRIKELSNRWDVNIRLQIKDDGIYRLTGEKVLTPEVVVYELAERFRNADSDYKLSLETARDMFFSVLSPEEERAFKEKDMTVVEGQESYYAIFNNKRHNSVLMVPKNSDSIEDVKYLCIHPDEYKVPLMDGFATIALSVKSGDEKYITENSNMFNAPNEIKKKVFGLIGELFPTNVLSYA